MNAKNYIQARTIWSALLLGAAMNVQAASDNPGKQISKLMVYSEMHDASADYWRNAAVAENLPTKLERKQATAEAKGEIRSSFEDIEDQYEARLKVARQLGGGRYNPQIVPANFLTPAEAAAHPNPFMPLIPGKTHVYQSATDEGTEIVRVHVTSDTREIIGVTCFVVHDVAKLDGVIIEDTLDWYAQDVNGNVWYFGEQSLAYGNGKVTSIDGSWEAGEDGALPGIIMLASPVVGNFYRQEFALGEAEDVARVLSLTASETVPYGAFNNCLKTEDFTPMEPDHIENKFFAPGVGEILSVDIESGAREELIEIVTE